MKQVELSPTQRLTLVSYGLEPDSLRPHDNFGSYYFSKIGDALKEGKMAIALDGFHLEHHNFNDNFHQDTFFPGPYLFRPLDDRYFRITRFNPELSGTPLNEQSFSISAIKPRREGITDLLLQVEDGRPTTKISPLYPSDGGNYKVAFPNEISRGEIHKRVLEEIARIGNLEFGNCDIERNQDIDERVIDHQSFFTESGLEVVVSLLRRKGNISTAYPTELDLQVPQDNDFRTIAVFYELQNYLSFQKDRRTLTLNPSIYQARVLERALEILSQS